MEEFSIKNLGVKVGLEIHQQLATGKKLFCSCNPTESSAEYTIKFQRRLRASKSELGEFDPAALFESRRTKTILYYANSQNSCLVEQDEEPPHNLDEDAKNIALVISSALRSNIFSEVYPMRKTVIDGSNTTGFQRTMLISQGGFVDVGERRIGVQSICLEEDAAKNLGDEDSIRKFGLERLGIPLVEIATEPFEVELSEIKTIALALGRILRSTRKVKRGLGSIRQDVNVSIKDGRGVVIEVKGVQQLDQLEKVVEYEAKRQHGLLKISEKIKEKRWVYDRNDSKDITELFTDCKSKIIQSALKKDQKIVAITFRGIAGIFGYLPYKDIRLGKEIAELVRFFGVKGVFHSDELPNYGITEKDLEKLKRFSEINENDAYLILALPEEKVSIIIEQIILRVEHIKNHGIPIDTRLATVSGETQFLRPRPGAARMYPETDIPPIIITNEEMVEAKNNIPKSWDDSIQELETKYKLSSQLAEQVFDSRYMELFERIVRKNQITSPAFVASVLCSTITNLERSGLNSGLLKNEEIFKLFGLLDEKKVAKESIQIIFENIMSGKADTVTDAIKNTSIQSVGDEELEKIIIKIVNENEEIIKNQRERAVGPLMGVVMKELRGKASGEMVNALLLKNIKKRMREVGFEPTNS